MYQCLIIPFKFERLIYVKLSHFTIAKTLLGHVIYNSMSSLREMVIVTLVQNNQTMRHNAKPIVSSVLGSGSSPVLLCDDHKRDKSV